MVPVTGGYRNNDIAKGKKARRDDLTRDTMMI